nr:hypothetical protein [Isoptericola croceus]
MAGQSHSTQPCTQGSADVAASMSRYHRSCSAGPRAFAARTAQRTSSSVSVGASRNEISVDCAVACSAAYVTAVQVVARPVTMASRDASAAGVAQVPRTPVQPHVIPSTGPPGSGTTGASAPLTGHPPAG